MKNISLTFGIMLVFACSNSNISGETNEIDVATSDSLEVSSEKNLADILALIRNMNTWIDQGNNQVTAELITDEAGDNYVGMDLSDLKQKIAKLKSTGFFSQQFIDNYQSIQLAIHEKLRSGEMIYEIGTYPPYGSGANPWCECQDIPYDEPNPFTEIEIETVELTETKGKFNWKWANLDPNSDWGQHRYYFEVEKVDGKWKISYLEGFNFEESTRTKF